MHCDPSIASKQSCCFKLLSNSGTTQSSVYSYFMIKRQIICNQISAVFDRIMASDDDHGSDYNASDSGNEGQRLKTGASKRASPVLDKNTKPVDVENGTHSAMIPRGSERANGMQQAITDNLCKGF